MTTIYFKNLNKVVHNAAVSIYDEINYGDILWIDLENPSEEEQMAVENYLSIRLQTRGQLAEIESTSKYSETERTVVCNCNFFLPSGDSFVLVPVSFLLCENILVSLHFDPSPTLVEAAMRLHMNYGSYPTGYHMLVAILEIRIDLDADMLETVSRDVAHLSNRLSSADIVNRSVLQQINHLQENTIVLRENIFDRQRSLSGISRSDKFPPEIMKKVRLMMKDVHSLIDHIDFSSARLDYMQDTALGFISIEQNKTTKIFTIASVFFLPATLIASIYGMNFDYMPELHIRYGYFFSLGVMIVISILAYLFLKWKKML